MKTIYNWISVEWSPEEIKSFLDIQKPKKTLIERAKEYWTPEVTLTEPIPLWVEYWEDRSYEKNKANKVALDKMIDRIDATQTWKPVWVNPEVEVKTENEKTICYTSKFKNSSPLSGGSIHYKRQKDCAEALWVSQATISDHMRSGKPMKDWLYIHRSK